MVGASSLRTRQSSGAHCPSYDVQADGLAQHRQVLIEHMESEKTGHLGGDLAMLSGMTQKTGGKLPPLPPRENWLMMTLA